MIRIAGLNKLMTLLIVFLFSSFTQTSNKSASNLIVGTWKPVGNKSLFTTIEFRRDNGAIFYNFGDTILSYRYSVKENDLTLTDRNNETKHNKIIGLFKDSLIMEKLLWDEGPQTYLRISE